MSIEPVDKVVRIIDSPPITFIIFIITSVGFLVVFVSLIAVLVVDGVFEWIGLPVLAYFLWASISTGKRIFLRGNASSEKTADSEGGMNRRYR